MMLLGLCGVSQPAANDLFYFLCYLTKSCNKEVASSHGLCNDFYVNAFENDFIADNFYNCSKVLQAEDLPENFKMGYSETRKK